jgi:hypothetical protein
LQTSLKEGNREWKEAQRQGEDRMTLRKTLVFKLGLGFSLGGDSPLNASLIGLWAPLQKGPILIYLIKNRQDWKSLEFFFKNLKPIKVILIFFFFLLIMRFFKNVCENWNWRFLKKKVRTAQHWI